MKTFVITTIIKCADEIEGRKSDKSVVYRYLETLEMKGVIKRHTLRGNVALKIEDVSYEVMEV